MCGRFRLQTEAERLQRELLLTEAPPVRPRYNVAPGQEVLTVVAGAGGREGRLRRWGLVPSWAEDPKIGNRMINARSETVAEKPAFRSAFARRRCLVVADGFYEWQARGRVKQPYLIRLAGGAPFTFAGLWERWSRGGEVLESCTILTTEANDRIREIHDRMPVILAAADRDTWLAEETPREALLALFRPFPPDEIDAYEVSTHVNRPANDDPECCRPLAEPQVPVA